MDPQESGGGVKMNQIYRKRSFWSLAGPLLGYLGIQFAVQFAAQFVIEMPYIMQAYAKVLCGSGDTVPSMQELMESSMQALGPAFEAVARHQVEITALSALGTIILTGILFARDRKSEQKAGIILPEKAQLSKYWTVIIFGIAGCIAATCLMAMVQLAFYDEQYQQTAQITYSAGFPVQVIGLGVVIPVAEELMFRGILYKRFRERQGFWYSAVWSALLFSLMHSSTTQMIYAFLLGLLLSYLYEKFASFKAPVLLHILLNTGSVVFTELGVFRWLASDPMRMAAAVIAGAFLCSAMFVMIQKMPVSIKAQNCADDSDRTDMFS